MPTAAARFLILLFGSLFCLLAYSQLYKWTDEEGRVHYSDRGPGKGSAEKIEIKINSYSGPAVVSSLPKSGPAKEQGRVRMFTTTWCGYCKQARAHLSAKGIPFEDLDVEKSVNGKQEYATLKGRGVPIILVGDQRMDGYSRTRLDSMLRAAGY